jgi:hypothetical protein
VSHDIDSMLAAVRAAGDGDHGTLAQSTRTRVRRSLERRARTRHRSVRGATIALVLLVSTVSWALSTGRMPLLSPARESQPEPIELELPSLPSPVRVEQTRPVRPRTAEPAVAEIPAEPLHAVPDPQWPVAPSEVPAPVKPVPVKRPAAVRPAEVLYRKAHALHFHNTDGDWSGVLAAWDAYLAGEPTGRFAVEARYNRALVLVRLGRYADARTALAPYARGEHAGYRQLEATQLIERLDQIGVNGSPGSGD